MVKREDIVYDAVNPLTDSPLIPSSKIQNRSTIISTRQTSGNESTHNQLLITRD